MLTHKVAGRIYNYDYCIGREGTSGNSFLQPQGFAVGSGGSLYVISKGNEFVPAYGITKCNLNHEINWEERGLSFAGGESPWPASVALDSNENVYVSDDYTSIISMHDKDGNFLGTWGTKGSGDGELDGPSGLAFDKDDNLYVVDSLNHRVQKFTKDGKFLAKWGSQGSGPGQFSFPWGISTDKEGNVYVADWKNDRVQKLTPDGKHLASFGSSGTGDGQLRAPTGVAIDSEGDVYVTDWGNDRLNIYASDGTFITSFIGDAERLSPWCEESVQASPDYIKARKRVDLTEEWRFKRPAAVNVDNEGRIMVLETVRARIQVYVKEPTWVDAQFNL